MNELQQQTNYLSHIALSLIGHILGYFKNIPAGLASWSLNAIEIGPRETELQETKQRSVCV